MQNLSAFLCQYDPDNNSIIITINGRLYCCDFADFLEVMRVLTAFVNQIVSIKYNTSDLLPADGKIIAEELDRYFKHKMGPGEQLDV